MPSLDSSRHLHGRGLLVVDDVHVEAVDYWLVFRRDDEEPRITSGWIAANLSMLERLWPDHREVTLVLRDGRTLKVELTSEFGACVAVDPPA